MNQRIKQLAEQAQKVVGYTDVGFTEIQALDTERFAQLVAQRCAAIYEAIDNGNAVHGTNDYVEALRREFEV